MDVQSALEFRLSPKTVLTFKTISMKSTNIYFLTNLEEQQEEKGFPQENLCLATLA